MPTLALDTATPAISAALVDRDSVLAEFSHEGAQAHGELLMPTVASAMDEARVERSEITDIVVGVGPGPFTGLRVGVVTALTLGDAWDVPVRGVCTLDGLAYQTDNHEFLVLTDARRREVYWAHYLNGRRVEGPGVATAADVAARFPDVPAYGRGAHLYATDVPSFGGAPDPRAASLALALYTGRAEELPVEPLYLRRPDATPSRRIKSA